MIKLHVQFLATQQKSTNYQFRRKKNLVFNRINLMMPSKRLPEKSDLVQNTQGRFLLQFVQNVQGRS